MHRDASVCDPDDDVDVGLELARANVAFTLAEWYTQIVSFLDDEVAVFI